MKMYRYCVLFVVVVSLMTGCVSDMASDVLETNQLVYISKGSIQCEGGGLSSGESAALLIQIGIDVIASYCGYLTDLSTTAVYGAQTVDINLHEIPAQSVVDAQEIGFEPVSSLENDYDQGYAIMDCPE